MKLTMLLLTVGFLNVSATALSQNVSLSGKNLPLETVFKEVKQQTGFIFLYPEIVLSKAKPVEVHVSNMPLNTFLEVLFKGQPLTYFIESKTINVTLLPDARANDRQPELSPGTNYLSDTLVNVQGRVSNDKGEFVGGILVSVKLGKAAAVTDDQGYFNIRNISSKSVLVFIGFNYQAKEIRVPQNGYAAVTLTTKVLQLDSVVVRNINTGYQILKKERATGSFGQPNMEVFSQRTGSMDVMARLEGLVPGLTVNRGQVTNSNGNGIATQSVVIRGASSIQLGTEPLYVVNGVVTNDFATVNLDDVTDITVLKDAAAAAIWGARAANGVVVVTTRQGAKNQRLTIGYSGFVNFQGKPDFDYLKRLNSAQYIQAAKETFDPKTYPWATLSRQSVAPHDVILYNQYRGLITAAQANKSLDSLAAIDNSGQISDLLYRNAMTTNHTISASGGNNIYSFYASLGYTSVASNTPGQKNNSYRINVTQNLHPNKRIQVTLNTQMTNVITSGKNYPGVTNTFLPYQLFKGPSGENLPMSYLLGFSDSLRQNYQARSATNLDYIPLDEVNYKYTQSNTLAFNVTANVGVNIWKGLSFQGTYGFMREPGNVTSYQDSKTREQRNTLLSLTVAPTIGSTPVYYYPTTGGLYTNSSNDQRNWTVRNQLVYAANPRNGKDALNIQVGQDAQESFGSRATTTIPGYDAALNSYPAIDYATLRKGVPGTILGFGSLTTQPYVYIQNQSRFTSYFALASYSYQQKYSLDLSWRQDHSNLFGHDESTQNKPIWSVGGKWQIGKESFMKRTNNWQNMLALRATYGITGNSPYVGAASLFDILRVVDANQQIGAVAGNALSISQPANTTLSWEITHTTNLGLDFSLLKDRISGSLDVYNKMTTGLIGNVTLNPFSGFASQTGNIGELSNKGIELALKTVNIKLRDFSWSTNIAFSYNKNKLLSYVDVNPQFFNANSKITSSYQVGYSLGPLFAYRYAGLDNMGDPQIYIKDHAVSKALDAATPDDVAYMGTMRPTFNGGLSNTFSYRGISLSVNMIYSLGNVMRREMNQFYTGRMWSSTAFNGPTISPEFLDRWKQPGDEQKTNVPSYVAGSASSSRRSVGYYVYGDLNVVSADYAKIRDITLGYDLPAYLLQRIKIRNIRVYAQATNFLVWTANSDHADPEYSSIQNGGRTLPPFKHSFSLGTNITF
ncbi:SusC/RagA family TonB-linked outer membrane protein [Chitinophaga arvensicola]|nr:SusC/RagA family TonB-linked outer membrane protein [Chitinophaga arvensicola]